MMTLDEFMEQVVYPATNANDDVDEVDPLGMVEAYVVKMTDGSRFRIEPHWS